MIMLFSSGIQKNIILLLVMLAVLFSSCSGDDDKDVICTEEFRLIGVKVFGGELTDYYTIRTETSDTIRYTDDESYPVSNWYPILDDSFQPLIENTEEQFIFTGVINDTIVLVQSYVIGADKCHIFKASGPGEINLFIARGFIN